MENDNAKMAVLRQFIRCLDVQCMQMHAPSVVHSHYFQFVFFWLSVSMSSDQDRSQYREMNI